MIRTLGDLIETLSNFPADMPVRYQNGSRPEAFYSWRGDYAQLTLAPDSDIALTVGDLYRSATKAVGHTFEGYKGGFFTMGNHSELYADHYGHCPGVRIEAVIEDEWGVVLITDAQAWLTS